MIEYNGRLIPETFHEIIDPKHTALIVHELLHDFVTEGGVFDQLGIWVDASDIVPPIVKLISAARKNNMKIIYMRFTNYADYSNYNEPMIQKRYESVMDPQKVPAVVKGTWGWENIPEVAPKVADFIIPKLRVDCFIQTELDMILKSNGIKTIVIAGIGSEVGIVPTVAHGMNLGYFCVAPADCIRPTVAKNHELAKRFIGRYAFLNESSEILKSWLS
jgi:nicotinamidase-related amidase